MPLTPQFELSQTETQVVVTIFVPTVRVTNIEVIVEESDSTFHFYANPYLLKLHFAPHKFAEDGNVPVQYDPSSQTIRVPLNKAQPGLEWPNLDLTARLLQPKEIPKQWLHAVETSIDSNHHEPQSYNGNNNNNDNNSDTSNNPTKDIDNDNHDTPCHGYGFRGIFQNIFTDYCRAGLAQEMLQLKDPESTSPLDRRTQRIHKEEKEDFDPERYIQDLYIQEDYLYPLVMEFHPFWSNAVNSVEDQLASQIQQQLTIHSSDLSTNSSNNPTTTTITTTTTFTTEERLQLATIPYPLIPTKQLLDISDDSELWPGLIDLIVPFVYDHLTTMGDPTVESAWTITILSSSLSWLDPPTTMIQAVQSLTRRMLIYPYWRNHDFTIHVWNHTISLLKTGLYAVVKCLLQTRSILEKSESYYVGNKLFVDPFLYWIQQLDASMIPTKIIEELEHQICTCAPDQLKQMVGLGLLEIEQRHRMMEEGALDSDVSSRRNETDSSDDSSSDTGSSCNSEENEQDSPSPTAEQIKQIENSNITMDTQQEERTEQVPQLLDSLIGEKTTTSILQIVPDERESGPNQSKDNVSGKTTSLLIQEYDPS